MASLSCGDCGQQFQIPDSFSGEVHCPLCQAKVRDAVSPLATGLTPPSQAASPQAGGLPLTLPPWLTGQRKFLLFGIIGAVGCLTGALLGQLFLSLFQAPSQEQAICLLIDCSGSMDASNKLAEVKAAAVEFAQKQKGTQAEMAVVGFGDDVHIACTLTTDQETVVEAIERLNDGGSTNMSEAVNDAAELLEKTPIETRQILLFTDGCPDNTENTARAAGSARASGIDIAAIGTEDAENEYLVRLTGDRQLVIDTKIGDFAEAFRVAEERLDSLIGTGGGFRRQLLQVGVWTALIALGLCLGLIGGQNLYMRRKFLSPSEGVIGTIGALGAGFIAGAAGQILCSPLAKWPPLAQLGTLVGWTVLGALVGRGMAMFVPNIEPRKAWVGGLIGGAASGIVFIRATGMVGGVAGRLLGAAVLGLAIGLLVALVEMAFRRAWLEVAYGPKEVITVNLGREPVTIGGDRAVCTVFVLDAPPAAARYRMADDAIIFDDLQTSASSRVEPGDRRVIGGVTITVCASGETGQAGTSESAEGQTEADQEQ